MRNFLKFALVVPVSICALGQAPSEPLHMGPGVTPPRLIHKQEPEYSPLARRDLIQGSVVFSTVINERGLPTNIQVISPLGFGLDEKAEEAIRKWRFIPGMKEGKPVPVIAQIEVNFRFPSIWFDEKAERRRTSFNLALKNLAAVNQDTRNGAVETVHKLAAEKLPAAMYLAGRWEARGENGVARNEAAGWALIEESAKERYGPAMYEVAMRTINAGADPAEMDVQQKEVRDAAVLGSTQAQYYLARYTRRARASPLTWNALAVTSGYAPPRAFRCAGTGSDAGWWMISHPGMIVTSRVLRGWSWRVIRIFRKPK